MKLSFDGGNNRKSKSICLVFLKIPESPWFPTNDNLNHMSTNSTNIFFLYPSTVKVWQDIRGLWNQMGKMTEQTAFLMNKLFHFLTESLKKTKPKHQKTHTAKPCLLNSTLSFGFTCVIKSTYCFVNLCSCKTVPK